MSEFEDKINALLGDPEQMEKITQMAKSLMGGDDKAQPEKEDAGGIDPGLVSKITGLLQKTGEKGNERTALLNAMKPYLSEKRRAKMEKAIKLARLAELAQLAAGDFGGEGDV